MDPGQKRDTCLGSHRETMMNQGIKLRALKVQLTAQTTNQQADHRPSPWGTMISQIRFGVPFLICHVYKKQAAH